MKIRRKKFMFHIIITISVIAVSWLLLTLWVERKGPAQNWHIGNLSSTRKVLIVFDPDPIYNLDEQLCKSLGEGLGTKDCNVTIATVAAAEKIEKDDFTCFVLCANTYNWAPDWAISNFIESTSELADKPVAAITVGSGSTQHAQVVLEDLLVKHGGKLIATKTWWLMRPNDEEHLSESNVEVARSLAYQTGLQLADSIF